MTLQKRTFYLKVLCALGFLFFHERSVAQANEGIELLESRYKTTISADQQYNLPHTKGKEIHIQEVSLKDTILINEIRKIIGEETEQREMFKKGLGYIVVFSNACEHLYRQIMDFKNIDQCYYVTVDYTGLKRVNSKNTKAYLLYPDFYSFIDRRLVFIKFNTLNTMISRTFTKKSMRKLRKIQDDYLEKEKRVVFYDMNKKKAFTDKHFRIDYRTIHGGKYIYIYRDKSYAVKRDPDNE
jgi:hypothetical protein